MQNTLVFNPLLLPKRVVLKINLKNLLIVSFLLILILLIFYLFQVKMLVSQNYQIQNYNKKISQLSKENEILEINLSKNNALENLELKIKELGFEKIDKIRFLWLLEGQVVQKESINY